jgi:proteasome lid subunit RPN8/RPN11
MAPGVQKLSIPRNERVVVTRGVVDELLIEARREPNLECCGLLAGRDGVISLVMPARNALQSGAAYEIDPAELFSLFRRMRDERLDHLGIYHSHPQMENAPSSSDIAQAFYPEAAYFIISPAPMAQRPLRAFRIAEGKVTELVIDTL